MPRLFIAFDVPDAVRAAVKELQRDLPGARWTPPEQHHVTLRFLGDVAAERVPELQRKLSEVKAAAFSLALLGLGTFPRQPNARHPARVLFVSLAPEEPVHALKRAIDVDVDLVLGPDAESAERGFSPHLTLARFREDPGAALGRYLDTHAEFATLPWPVVEFSLYASTLGPEGARHERLGSWALLGAP